MPTPSHRLAAAVLVSLTLAVLPFVSSNAGSDIGVVVLHGKQGAPGDRTIAPLIRELMLAGYAVRAPQMCWSGNRIYDATFPGCLRDIDTAVAAVRAGGARRIVVAGQSLGALAALVYSAQHLDLAGVIALAPAGTPSRLARNPRVAQSIARARQMLAAGQGEQRTNFDDVNAGVNFTVYTTPAIFLSFMDPSGPADFVASLPQIRVPVIWVAGTQDPSQDQAQALFGRLPANPLSRFIQVTSTHLGTPQAGASSVLDWLKTLPAR
jgi:pimeloyl-ACP methyl ester carboxylesterase